MTAPSLRTLEQFEAGGVSAPGEGGSHAVQSTSHLPLRSRTRNSVRLQPALALTVAGWIATASVVCAAPLATGPSVDIPLVRIAAGLALCTLVAFVAALVVKRHLGGRRLSVLKSWRLDPHRSVTLHETRRLSTHADICRFSSAGKEYLVVVSAGATTVIREADVSADGEIFPT